MFRTTQACILRNWRVLISCSALFKEDAELVSLAIEQGSYQAIGCVSETVQEANDFALVKQAIRKDPRAVKLVCPSAKKDEQVARLVAELGGSILHLDECWRSHKETVVTAIRNAVKKNTGVYFENLCGAEEVVRMDEEIVRCLIDVVRTSEQIKTQKKTAFLADLRCVQQAGKIAQSVEIPECFSD